MTTSWIMAGFLALATFTLTITVRAWRESKRSPYFFLRRQAEQKMLQYGSSSIVLIMVAGAIALFAQTPSTDNITRMAMLESVKPALADALAMAETVETESASINISPAMVAEANAQLAVIETAADTITPVRIATNDLPAEYSQQFLESKK